MHGSRDSSHDLCAVCFNVLKRTNRLIQGDGEKRDKINQFMEKDYREISGFSITWRS